MSALSALMRGGGASAQQHSQARTGTGKGEGEGARTGKGAGTGRRWVRERGSYARQRASCEERGGPQHWGAGGMPKRDKRKAESDLPQMPARGAGRSYCFQ